MGGGVLHHPRAPGAVGSGLHPQAGQAAAGGKNVVEQLEHDVCLLPGKLGAPQPDPYVAQGSSGHRTVTLGGRGVSMKAT